MNSSISRRVAVLVSGGALMAGAGLPQTKAAEPNDPLFFYDRGLVTTMEPGPYQWYLQNVGEQGARAGTDVNVVDAWDGVTGAGVVIGLIDDGVFTGHEDLTQIDLALSNNWNDGAPGDPNPLLFSENHGTCMAGIIAAAASNELGIAGTAYGATVAGLRLTATPGGLVDDADAAQALRWSLDDDDPSEISVFVSSWGNLDNMTSLQGPGSLALDAIKRSVWNPDDTTTVGRGGSGTIYVWAAGDGAENNDNSNYDGAANMPETIAVGSVDDKGVKVTYSEPGANLVVVAPSGGKSSGYNIVTTDIPTGEPPTDPAAPPDGYTYDFEGTAASAAIVSGVVALMLEKNPALGWRDVQEILMKTAKSGYPPDSRWHTNSGGFTFNHGYGAGLVDAKAAVDMADGWTNLGPRVEQSGFVSLPAKDIPNGDGTSLIVQFDLSDQTNLRVEHVVVEPVILHERRADLKIVLISPNGTQSVLAKPHNNSIEQSIFEWPFMTVRNWGEGSKGVWSLRIEDVNPDNPGLPNVLNTVRLRVFGTDDAAAPVSNKPIVLTDTELEGIETVEFRYVLATHGATSVDVYGLPNGLKYNSATGEISGTPSKSGSFSATVDMTGPGGNATVALNFFIKPLAGVLGTALGQPDMETYSNGSEAAVKSWEFEYIDTNGDKDAVRTAPNMQDGWWSQFGFHQTVEGPSVMLFDWRVSSEAGPVPPTSDPGDLLYCTVGDDSPMQSWSAFIDGDPVWRQMAVLLPDEETNQVKWRYVKDADGTGGLDMALVNNVCFVDAVEFHNKVMEALEANFDVIQTGRALWLPERTYPVPDPGIPDPVLVSPGIGNGQFAMLEATLEGPGELSFEWKVSSEDNDGLTLLLNGVPWKMRSGEAGTDWQTVQVPLPAGSNVVQWEFRKDLTDRESIEDPAQTKADRAWLDGFNFLSVTGFEAWARANGIGSGVFGVAADPNGDPDGDGSDNFAEYAWGTNPKVPDVSSHMPSVTTTPDAGGSTLVAIEYTTDSSRTDLIYTFEQSTNLEAWTPVATAPVLVGSEGSLQTWRYEVMAPGDGPSKYFRVSVEQKP
jgi:subtilisin-like proprotein convertase family protein